MKPHLAYYSNCRDVELHNPGAREMSLLSRREFVKRGTLFLPLAFFAGGLVRTAKASTTIINRTISGGSQNAAQMVNATWARPVTLRNGWTKARVGCRVHFTNTGGSLSSNPIFAFGFCSGTSQQYGSATTLNFIGIAWDAASWSYDASGVSPVYTVPLNGSQPVYRTRIGTTNTDSRANAAGGGYTINAGAALADADRQIIFIDISTGSPNYSLKMPFVSASGTPNQPAGDVTASNFLVYMGLPTPAPVEGNYQTASINTGSLAFSESVNPLNAINFYWNRVDLSPEICDVAVAVLA